MTNGFPCHILSACAFITNRDGEVLLARTVVRGWDFPGGVVESNENPVNAVIRETLEETGVTIRVERLAGLYTNLTRQSLVVAYYAQYIEGELHASYETPEVKWFSRSKIGEVITHPPAQHRARDFLSFDGRVMHRAYQQNPYAVMSEHRL
jgi:8-oxo-dGTP diphosphatase